MKVESYDLSLDVDFPKAYVRGSVGITVAGSENPLVLDAGSIKVRSAKVEGKAARFVHDRVHSKLKIYSVPKRRSLVEIKYVKQVPDDTIFGLYKARYGKEYMLSTDLEPNEARTVFPCKDEPAYKAVFRLQVTTQSGLKVIANTQASRVEKAQGGKTRFVFEPTPRMSTYLFFFAIGKFEELTVPSGEIDVIGATRPGQSKDSRFVLETTAAVLADYQKYFDIPYPLKKLHVVAVPEYHTGAMENWGAIASREARVLINEESSFSERLRAATTQAHEVGHMWFGDLVTMKWWDDLWLNESFATLMEYKMMDRLHPEWELWEEFFKVETFPALNLDALSSTHPIQVHVGKASEVNHLFDIISYNKGASVLRMLETYVGEDAFRRGVSDYLKKFSYSNASGSDLWRALGAASRLPVARVARAWLTKPGFPVVKVSTTKDGYKLSQSQLRLNGRPRGTWPIPVDMLIDGHRKSLLLSRKSVTVGSGAGEELLVNVGRTGFFSVLYDGPGYESLAGRFPDLGSRDRAGLMADLYLFLQAGLVDPRLYFRFVSIAGRTLDSLATETTASQLHFLRAIADEAPIVRRSYSKFYRPLLRQLGETARPGEPETMGGTRETLMTNYAQADPAYARKLAGRFDDYAHLDPNLKEAVAISYAVTKGEAAKAPLIKLVKTLQSEVDRGKIYSALVSARDPRMVEETLELGIGGEVPRSDSAYPFINGASNPYARDAMWNWLTRRYDALRGIYGDSQQFYIFMLIALPLFGVAREDEVRRFISGKKLKEGGSTYVRLLELLGVYSRLRKRLLALGDPQKED